VAVAEAEAEAEAEAAVAVAARHIGNDSEKSVREKKPATTTDFGRRDTQCRMANHLAMALALPATDSKTGMWHGGGGLGQV